MEHEETYKCEFCGDAHSREDLHRVDDDMVCNDCFNAHYGFCENCERVEMKDDLTDGLCEACTEIRDAEVARMEDDGSPTIEVARPNPQMEAFNLSVRLGNLTAAVNEAAMAIIPRLQQVLPVLMMNPRHLESAPEVIVRAWVDKLDEAESTLTEIADALLGIREHGGYVEWQTAELEKLNEEVEQG